MYSKTYITLFLISFFCFDYLCSAPTITSVSTLDTTMSITGTGFGIKSTIQPIRWDNFDQQQFDIGDQIGNGWSYRDSKDVIRYTATGQRPGSDKHVRTIIGGGNGAWGTGRFWYTHDSDLQEVYVTFWRKMSITEGSVRSDNYKWLSVWNSMTAFQYPHFSICYQPVYGSTITTIRAEGVPAYYAFSRWVRILPPDSMWTRFELYIKESSAIDGVFDGREAGRIKMLLHAGGDESSSLIINETTGTNRSGYSHHFREVMFNEYLGHENNDVITVDIDDIYIDKTQARVEIGDKQIWAECTHREIQILTEWSESSITFNVNKGSFIDGQAAYVFVVDAAGNPSNGQQITIGDLASGGDSGEEQQDLLAPVLNCLK